MKFIDDLKIGKKITVPFLIIAILLIFISATGYTGAGNPVAAEDDQNSAALQPEENLAASTAAIEKMRGDLNLYIAMPAERDALGDSIGRQIAIVDENMAAYGGRTLNADEKASLSRFTSAWQKMQEGYRQVMSDTKANNGKAVNLALAANSSITRAYETALTEIQFESSQVKITQETRQAEADERAGVTRQIILVATILAILICIAAAWCLTRSVIDPITRITRGIRDFHEGKVSNRVALKRNDEFGEMGAALDTFSADFEKYILGTMKMVADGDLSRNLKPRGEKDEMIPPIKKMIETLRALIVESNALSRAAVEGKLGVRGNAGQFKGGYWEIIAGMNKTMDYVVNPLQEGMRVSAEYANGNFTTRFDKNIEVHGDFKKFRQSLENIGSQISSALGSVRRHTTDLQAAAEQAAAGTHEIAAGADQIADNAQKVNENSGKCNAGIEQVLKAVEDMGKAIQEVTNNMENVSEQALHALDEAKGGATLAKDVERDMSEIATSTQSVSNIVREIENQMQEITKIVGLIQDLASQTNMLALNAAIEAARAGESGRGFAVVAAEVKSLAEESRTSAEKIEQMINELSHSTRNAAVATKNSNDLVIKGNEMAVQTIAAFRKITDAADKVAGAAAEVAAATQEQAATTEEITANMHELQVQVTRTSKEAGDAAAATEETAASIVEINKVVDNVRSITDNVSKELGRFTV